MLIGLTIVVVMTAFFLPPVPQPTAYHQFADQRSFLGIPNFGNVVSNLAFIWSGGAGLAYLLRIYHMPAHMAFRNKMECLPYGVLFFSVIATALGSMVYHWIPDHVTLLWDRLPIAIAITALLAAMISERVNPVLGLWSLPILTGLGILSVLYWYWTEQQGVGNLNYYAVIQFYSIFLIVLLSLCYPSRYTCAQDIYQVIALYALAKFTELLDMQIYRLTDFLVSGHTLKHLLAALAVYQIVRMLQKRVFLIK